MSETMRAALLQEPGRMETVVTEIPHPKDHEALIKIESCGVCASNLPPWEGRPWFSYPFAPGALGHEATGVIVAHGEKFSGPAIGQRVALLSQHGYAEYDVAAGDALVPLPPSEEGRLFPGEPLGCAMNIFERAEIRAGDRVAIVGIGFLGALLVQLAVKAGARVVALARRNSARHWVDVPGVEFVEIESREQAVAEISQWSEGKWCDVVIEATGKQEPLHLAGELVRERGRLVIAGYHQDGLREVNLQLWNWRGFDVINAHERDPLRYVEGIRKAIEAVQDHRLDPDPLMTHRFPLEDLQTALELTRDRPDGFMKAVIIP